MADYEILKNRLSDHKYITFKAMLMSDGEINVFVMSKYYDYDQQLLKRIETPEPVGAEDFEKIYSIAMNWLHS